MVDSCLLLCLLYMQSSFVIRFPISLLLSHTTGIGNPRAGGTLRVGTLRRISVQEHGDVMFSQSFTRQSAPMGNANTETTGSNPLLFAHQLAITNTTNSKLLVAIFCCMAPIKQQVTSISSFFSHPWATPTLKQLGATHSSLLISWQ